MGIIFGIIVLMFVLAAADKDVEIVCRDESGNSVDWYYLYKLPQGYSNDFNQAERSTGLKYMHISSTTASEGWKLSDRFINDSTSFPGSTLSSILLNKDIVLVTYNDEPPNGPVDSTNGHTKGVIAAYNNTGFWLIHSVPEYPDIGAYQYPETGVHYGQSFLCLSLNLSQIDLVGKQQLYNEPNIYHAQVPDQFRHLVPNLVEAIGGKWPRKEPFWNYQILETRGGKRFDSFAKGRKFQRELYEDWVAPTLNVDLLVESWRHGPGMLPTNCTRQHSVMNVASISNSQLNVQFHSTKDHSKWCVSGDEKAAWICVGDINRAQRQMMRGGGTVCQLNKMMFAAYRNLVSDVEPCPKTGTELEDFLQILGIGELNEIKRE